MTTYVAMLRAVNVGGATVTMADLRDVGDGVGFSNARTHLNSGNLLFDMSRGSADTHAAALSAALAQHVGRSVPVVIRTPSQLQRALDAAHSRFSDADEKYVAIAFLDRSAGSAEPDALGDWPSEEYLIDGDRVHLHYPDGQARSKFTLAVIEKKLGVVATVRGVKTVAGLIAKAAQ